MEIDIDK